MQTISPDDTEDDFEPDDAELGEEEGQIEIEPDVDADADADEPVDADADADQPGSGEEVAALDELAEEELELLAEEEDADPAIDEAAELRAIRREELTMNVEAQAVRGDEFVCSSCFLVKRTSQLANKRKVLCRDCAA